MVDFTLLVTVPGQPEPIRVFTASEEPEAHQYATDTGGTVVPLPLPPPDGYTAGPDWGLIPQPTATCVGMANLPHPIDIDEAGIEPAQASIASGG